jgi:hypothetical protein
MQNGWALDHQAQPPSDLTLLTTPDAAIAALCAEAGLGAPETPLPERAVATPRASGPISIDSLATALDNAVAVRRPSYLRLTLSWNGALCDFRDPLDYLGYDGGAGIGSGPGMAVGAALALRDRGSDRLPVAVLGDGDFLMGATALWTAARHAVPLLIVVANNRSYFNDEVHQERVARDRGRPVENKHVGQAIADPDIDIAAIARAQGALAFGPVARMEDLGAVLAEAAEAAQNGRTVVVDVRILGGYSEAMAAGMTQD